MMSLRRACIRRTFAVHLNKRFAGWLTLNERTECTSVTDFQRIERSYDTEGETRVRT